MKENTHKPTKELEKIDTGELERLLREKKPNIFKGISGRQKNDILRSFTAVAVTVQESRTHSGPIPDPESLARYDEIIPDGANRIMLMTENQQAHRIEIEKKVASSHVNQSLLGQIFGFVIGLVGIGVGAYLAILGHEVAGTTLIGGTIVSLVSVFVIGKREQKRDTNVK